MGLDYQLVLWNKYKKAYDKIILYGILSYFICFMLITIIFNSQTSAETLIIRASGSLAAIMLHIILAIGPLSRLNTRFLPILYNRRHLGVGMFIVALVHGVLSLVQFHTLGDTNPVISLFISNLEYSSLINFPFQVLGFFALLILFTMASTSHDFFLNNLSPKIWKSLHMLVYLAYILIVFHVFLGAFQQETFPLTTGVFLIGFIMLISLHLIAAFREVKIDAKKSALENGWLKVCNVDEIEESRAKIFVVENERVAIYKYDNKISAIHNVCKHQGGPLGEGKIIDGCITCPWHGYQYLPENGQSPPPYTEKVATYQLKLIDNVIYINPVAFPEGTETEPIKI